MENVVAARRLRKSALKGAGYDIANESAKIDRVARSGSLRSVGKARRVLDNEKPKINFKSKFMIKVFISVLIVFTTLFCKLMIKDRVLNSSKAQVVIGEYNKDWSKESVTEKFEQGVSKLYSKIKYVIPEKLKVACSEKYFSSVKPRYLNFNLYTFLGKLISTETQAQVEEEKIVEEIKEEEVTVEENSGIGGAEPAGESSSAISSMDEDLEEIRAKTINIIKPTSGTITSTYGAREEIFEGVNSYHTGTDIANKQGTKIISATTGKVVAAVYGNMYYGNYVEVETDGVIFKYAHMESISVKEGDSIKQGDEVGLMGSTGMSTGPHLHFEIKINSRTVDPQELVDL